MAKRRCVICNDPIPAERLEFLPETETCVRHSTEKKHVVLSEYGHKTAPSLIVIDADDSEAVRRADRAFKRAR